MCFLGGILEIMFNARLVFAVAILALVGRGANADIAARTYVDRGVGELADALAVKQDKDTAVTHQKNVAVGGQNVPVYVGGDGAVKQVVGIDAGLMPVATATNAGIARLGVIPAGTDKSAVAELWLE